MMNEASALSRLMAHVGVVEKDKTNNHFHYSYQSEAAIKLAAQQAFIAVGSAPTSIEFEILSDEWVKLGRHDNVNLVNVRCTIHFQGGKFQGLGSGSGTDDKSVMKAQTAAYREALKAMICVPSQGDPEDDHEAPARHVTIQSKLPGGPHEGTALIECPEKYLEELIETRKDDWGRMANSALNAIRKKQDADG